MYHIVSDHYQCGHIKGTSPYRCTDDGIYVADCERICTSFSWCIAYSTDEDVICELVSSSGLCPKGWKDLSGPIALSHNDLVTSNIFGPNCKAKVNGMIRSNHIMFWATISHLHVITYRETGRSQHSPIYTGCFSDEACLNGGTCSSSLHTGSCACKNDFWGSNCEKRKHLITLTLTK